MDFSLQAFMGKNFIDKTNFILIIIFTIMINHPTYKTKIL